MAKNKGKKRSRRGPAPDYSAAAGGGALLAAALGDLPQAEAARMVGVTPAFLNHVIRGRKTPGRKLAICIRDVFGVPVDAW